MAITVVQSKAGASTGAAVSFTSTPTVGNLIVVAEYSFGTIPVPSDNQGNTYTEQIEKQDASGNFVAIATAKATTSSGTFTVTPGASALAFIMELSGWDGTTVLDGTAQSAAQAATTAPSTLNNGNITLSNGNSMFVTASIDQLSHTFTAAIGGSAMNQQFQATTTDSDYCWTYAPGSTGTYTPSVSDTSVGGSNTFAIVTIAVLGSGPADASLRINNSRGIRPRPFAPGIAR